MNEFVIGPSGSGKSYYNCNEYLVPELLKPDGRYIVTTLPIIMHELQSFIHRKGMRFDVSTRITILMRNQGRQFWRHRGGGYIRDIPENDPKEKTELELLNNDQIAEKTHDEIHRRGVLYLMDEVHVFYPARGFHDTGNWVVQYFTLHRHFGDDIVMTTQSLSYVEKIFRENVESFTYMENEKTRQVRGFRKGSGLVARKYKYPPRLGTEEADKTIELPIDIEGVGRIYDTSGASGIENGGNADKGRKAKGLPLKSLYFFGAAAIVMIAVLLIGGKRLLDKWLRGKTEEITHQAAPVVPGIDLPVRTSSAENHIAYPAPSEAVNNLQAPDSPAAVKQDVYWTRFLQKGDVSYVYLTDGRVVAAPSRIEYNAAGLVDFIDLTGNHWRLSRAPLSWSNTTQEQKTP